MAQNITLMGASYSDVPAVTLPKTGGGTAQFDDTSDANAAAGDIASGKTAYVNGTKVTGTASGGGGLTYESGTYSPTSDEAQPTISFSQSHNSKPIFVLIADVTGTVQSANNSEMFWADIDYYTAFGQMLKVGSNNYYARRQGGYKATSNTMNATGSNDTSNNTTIVSSSSFKPSNGASYYFRSGRTYKWIAVWAP